MRRRNSFYRTLKNVSPEDDGFEMDRGANAAAQNLWVFEIAWEVANKGKFNLLAFTLTCRRSG